MIGQNLKNMKRHYEAVQRILSGRLKHLVDLGNNSMLSDDQLHEVKTLYAMVAPMNALADDMNGLILDLGGK